MKILTVLALLLSLSCTKPEPYVKITQGDYQGILDSLDQLNLQLKYKSLEVLTLQDSCTLLRNRPLMTVEHFLTLYRYDRLYKYYKICKGNPSQWKYYKGWSTRVFEGEEE